MEFSDESHKNKLKPLIRSFNKHILKQLGNIELEHSLVIEYMAMFELIAHQAGDSLVIQIRNIDIEKRLIALIDSKEISPVQQFVLFRFISRCKCDSNELLVKQIMKMNSNKF